MTLEEFNTLKSEHPAVMLYFYNHTCGVCSMLQPKVEALVKEQFPNIRLEMVHANESLELAGQLRMLTVPGMLLFLDGKEYVRANGMVSIQELESRIMRPYRLMFD
ncbi:MAG: thioredoxin family protein [Bacteroidota bacterium]